MKTGTVRQIVKGDPNCIHHRICEGQYVVRQRCIKCGDEIETFCIPPGDCDGGWSENKMRLEVQEPKEKLVDWRA